jgi:hypothetical protein
LRIANFGLGSRRARSLFAAQSAIRNSQSAIGSVHDG